MSDQITEEVEIPTFLVPEWNLGEVVNRVEKLDRKAQKIGMSGITLTVIGEKMVNDPRYTEKQIKDKNIPQIRMIEITVEGEPKIEGQTFVGTLDHVTIPGATMVHTVPGQTVPQQYFDHDGSCDHCNRIRMRNETFVVRGEDGVTQAVGRNCLRDFLGHTPRGLLGFLASLRDLFTDLEEEKFSGGGGGRGETRYYNLTTYLTTVASVIRVTGWTSRGAANYEDGREATADIALQILTPPWNPIPAQIKAHAELVAKYRATDEDARIAGESIIHMMKQESGHEFIHNCQLIIPTGLVSYKTAGYAGAIVSAYQRSQEQLKIREREFAALNNEFVGQVKDKIELEVTLKKVRGFDGAWNTVWMHEFRDNDGHVLIWMGNAGKLDFDTGDKFTIRGTIKAHTEYRDIKQTKLIRVKVI